MPLDKNKLLGDIIKEEVAASVTQAKELEPEKLRKEIEQILNEKSLTKSEKIRRLLSLGLTRGQTAKLMNVRYQQVYAVYDAMRRARAQ